MAKITKENMRQYRAFLTAQRKELDVEENLISYIDSLTWRLNNHTIDTNLPEKIDFCSTDDGVKIEQHITVDNYLDHYCYGVEYIPKEWTTISRYDIYLKDKISERKERLKSIQGRMQRAREYLTIKPRAFVDMLDENGSLGEKEVRKVLGKLNIEFTEQVTFSGLQDKRALRFDFELVGRKTLIEFDGKQHQEYISYFHKNENDFINQKRRDTIKTNWANNNGYKLIRICAIERIEETLLDL